MTLFQSVILKFQLLYHWKLGLSPKKDAWTSHNKEKGLKILKKVGSCNLIGIPIKRSILHCPSASKAPKPWEALKSGPFFEFEKWWEDNEQGFQPNSMHHPHM